MDVDAILLDLQILFQRFRGGCRIGRRNIEEQPVGKNPGRGIDREITSGQRFPVHFERQQAPGTEIQCVQRNSSRLSRNRS